MAEARVGFGKVALFRQESPEGLTYRIPALMYLPPESTFLAFAEERSSPSDNHAKSLVMRRGKKEGESVQNTSVLPEKAVEAQEGSEKVTLFHQEAPKGVTYRIPALLFLPDKSVFLAFAEKRSTPKDEDAEYLVMRRGQKEGTSVQWGPQQDLTSATLAGHRTMNPCPLYEKKSGRIFLFFICVSSKTTGWHQITTGRNVARLCYVVSQDGGRSWSQLTDLTDRVIGEDLRNWATFAVGPGHGVQLRSGRLVVPAYAYYIHQRFLRKPAVYHTRPHCLTFYSDDGGRNWSRGHLDMSFQMVECQVAELTRPDNSQVLYISARSPDKYRVEAFSTSGGNRFEESFLCKELPETDGGCQGSVADASDSTLVFSSTRPHWGRGPGRRPGCCTKGPAATRTWPSARKTRPFSLAACLRAE